MRSWRSCLRTARRFSIRPNFAGSKSDFVSALEIDSPGAAYVFGQTQSPDFPVTPGALQATLLPRLGQGFVVKVDTQGKVVYANADPGAARTSFRTATPT